MDSKRSPALPEVPTALESGFQELSNVIEWYGIVVPAGTPRDVVQKLSTSVIQVINAPDVKERITQIGQVPSPAGADEFERYIRTDYERWGRVVRASGARVE